MAEIDDDVTNDPIDDTVKIVLINAETNLPYDDGEESIVISGSEFRVLEKAAAAKGMTFEEYFTYVICLALKNSNEDFEKANFELENFSDLNN